MPTVTINGIKCEFTKGEMVIEVANRNEIDIPQYCYHAGLSRPAQCRICLATFEAPNPRNDNKLEPMMGGKLLPTCATEAGEGMVVTIESEKAIANQKAVMEFLLINHPLDCPVCDQAGECTLQDYSFKYGRGHSRFTDTKVVSPKKIMSDNVYMYSDRCIMCTRCVRFTDEVTQTHELMVDGRGDKCTIDVFPGMPLDNELASNVVDLCPVGSLIDKDFLFNQRVWFLKMSAGVDPFTSSGDNIWVEHNQGRLYRVKPRTNMDINTWWITDEVRYGWKFVHADTRLTTPMRREHGMMVEASWSRALGQAVDSMLGAKAEGKKTALVVSATLTCEEAYSLVKAAKMLDEDVELFVGPIPVDGDDQSFPNPQHGQPFMLRAEKVPNRKGIERVLGAFGGFKEFGTFVRRASDFGAVMMTANFPSNWVTDELADAIAGTKLILIDTTDSVLCSKAEVILPSSSFAEKAGSFENCTGILQHFDQGIPNQHQSKSEGQIALDLIELAAGGTLVEHAPGFGSQIVDEQPGQVPGAIDSILIPRGELFDALVIRARMVDEVDGLAVFATDVKMPPVVELVESDMEMVEL
ncbi:MAG: molybdopterin-dependent oxidoreductase [Phycisphaerales bacterium]|nr:molybdopterin-dependent oxidoreductase [Phycisphaerales bacterium]